MGGKVLYYDKKHDECGNVFENYFKPIAIEANAFNDQLIHISIDDVSSDCYYKYFLERENLLEDGQNLSLVYNNSSKALEILSIMYKKYFVLNEETEKYIYDSITELFGNTKETVLGVHIRGTDYKKNYQRHPIFVEFQEYVEACKKMTEEYGFEKIFLATDDSSVIGLFKKEFGTKVLFYPDTYRGDGETFTVFTSTKSPFESGREVIRDVYTLATCDGLVCGLSQVSYAARYTKMSKDEQYEVVHLVSKGVNL